MVIIIDRLHRPVVLEMNLQEGLSFLTAAQYLQDSNQLYSKPLNTQPSSIYDTKTLN